MQNAEVSLVISGVQLIFCIARYHEEDCCVCTELPLHTTLSRERHWPLNSAHASFEDCRGLSHHSRSMKRSGRIKLINLNECFSFLLRNLIPFFIIQMFSFLWTCQPLHAHFAEKTTYSLFCKVWVNTQRKPEVSDHDDLKFE